MVGGCCCHPVTMVTSSVTMITSRLGGRGCCCHPVTMVTSSVTMITSRLGGRGVLLPSCDYGN